jgi:hypothetical protein
MRTLSDHEKRTLRIALAGVAIYLALYGAFQLRKPLEKRRAAYQQLLVQARNLEREIQPYKDKAESAQRLMENFHLDPAKLKRATVVAEASAAIQKAASGGGLQLGPIRESPGRPSAKELASVQFEATGPVPAIVSLLSRLESTGYPLIIDSVQVTPDQRPGQTKLNLTLVILDYDQWKAEGMPHA